MHKPLVNAGLARLGSRIDRRIDSGDAAPDSLEACLALTEDMVSLEEARLVHELARDARGGCIVEVGSFRGRSTVALARGAAEGDNARVFAIDPHAEFKGALGGELGPEDRAAFMRVMLDTGACRQIALVNLSSEVAAAGWTTPVALDDSLDAKLGPAQLIDDLLAAGTRERARVVGKITVLRPVRSPA